ncbi:type IV secretory system conjugative DNA transfer family protein [Bacillus sp. BML-BC060]|uniref:type IV secretory system conjugative DNA transfer family protein n=1 Tax=Bacillus sp. BML-BC060 TaxID=2842487 RepID=UPI001C7F6886|nr:type IV secretory system conjugative DNA transfer family protein [Bacillus sp. BML-BC060]
MHSNHKIKEIITNFLLISSLVSSLYFTNEIHKDFMTELLSGDLQHIKTFIILLVSHLFVGFFLMYKFSNNRRKSLADSQLLSYKQLIPEQKLQRNHVFNISTQRSFKKNTSDLYISRNVRLTLKKSFEHMILLGATGSGKSASFFIPNLRNLDGVSFIVTDPKGELHEKTKAFLEKKGYQVLHMNFDPKIEEGKEPPPVVHYNLLGNCNNIDEVRNLAKALTTGMSSGSDDKVWGELAQKLLLCFLYDEYFDGEKNLSNVIKKMAELPSDNDVMEEYFSKTNEKAYFAFQQYRKTANADGYVASINAQLQKSLEVFEYDNMKEIGKKSDFSPSLFRQKKVALFVSYDDEKSDYYAAFLSPFYSQLLSKIKGDPSVDEKLGNDWGLPVIFFLDEAANIGRIPALEQYLATIRSKKMSVILGFQSFGQIQAVYGRDKYNVIVENCKTKTIFGGSGGETAKFFSELSGEEEYQSFSISSSSNDTSTSQSIQKKSVLSNDQIRRLKSYRVICVSDNLKTFIDDKNLYYFNDFQYFLFKRLPFHPETNEKIIRKIGNWGTRKKNKKQVEELKVEHLTKTTEKKMDFVVQREEKKVEKINEIRRMREERESKNRRFE